MAATEHRAPLHERLNHLATQFAEKAWANPNTPLSRFLLDHASSLAEFAQQCEDEYVRIHGLHEEEASDRPTMAQGVGLAQFMSAFGGRERRDRYATVSMGGAGLPDDYLHVRLADGYEGGIAPDGRVST